jgi:hypothetical protein
MNRDKPCTVNVYFHKILGIFPSGIPIQTTRELQLKTPWFLSWHSLFKGRLLEMGPANSPTLKRCHEKTALTPPLWLRLQLNWHFVTGESILRRQQGPIDRIAELNFKCRALGAEIFVQRNAECYLRLKSKSRFRLRIKFCGLIKCINCHLQGTQFWKKIVYILVFITIFCDIWSFVILVVCIQIAA